MHIYSLGKFTVITIIKEQDNYDGNNIRRNSYLFGGHRIVLSWVRTVEEGGSGKDCLQQLMII